MNWSVRQLAECSEVITKGTTPTTIGMPFCDSGIPFLRVKNIQNGIVEFQGDTLFIDELTHRTLGRSRIQHGDILLSIAGTIGRSALVQLSAPAEMNCNQAVAIIRLKEILHARFLLHWLSTPSALAQINGGAVTGTISNLSLTQVRNLKVPMPPLAEQRRIAEVLDQAEALRTKRGAALSHLDSLIQSVFLDLFGDPATNAKGWPHKTLSELGKVSTGATPPSSMPKMFDGPIPFITPGDLESDEPVKRSLTPAGADESRTVRAGSTLVCCIGATIGKIGMARIRSAFNQQINAVEWANEIHDLYGCAILRLFKPTIKAWGASTTLPILKKTSFEKMSIPVPPLPLQQEFARRLQAIETLRTVQKESLASLDELFTSLQYQAFRGEL